MSGYGEFEQCLDDVVRRLGSQSFHRRSRERYLKTLRFAAAWTQFTGFSRVAEVGPGPVLPTLCLAYRCQGTAFTLMRQGWEQSLKGLGIDLKKFDANKDNFPPAEHGTFDCAFFLEVIEHLNRWPYEVLSNIASILKPGGVLILSTPNFVRLSSRLRMIAGRSPLINPFVETEEGRNHVREYTLDELTHLFDLTGLQTVRAEYWQAPLVGKARLLIPLLGAMPTLRNYIFSCARRRPRRC